MPVRVDLNGDVGEGCGDDAALLQIVTSANIATGAHAGGGDVMRATVAQAAAAGCAIGAHPSYRDREGFGRASFAKVIEPDEFREDLVRQILDVAVVCADHGASLSHVKAHGALYHDAAHDLSMAHLLVASVEEAAQLLGTALAVVSLPGSVIESIAGEYGCPFRAEAFADRRYDAAGGLVARSVHGAVIDDPEQVRKQALSIVVDEVVTSDSGMAVRVPARTLCVHGDTPGAVRLAADIRRALHEAGVIVTADVDD